MQFFEQITDLAKALPRQAIVLCDGNTAEACFPLLDKDFPLIRIPAGEAFKNLESCKVVWDELLRLQADRNTHLICLGGGVLCDLGAFVASTFMRGISFTLVPTSLLGMVDASVGGKCGVDYGDLKNYIGLFSKAKDVLICPKFLDTLPTVEFTNGKMEMIKHGLICDAAHFRKIKQLNDLRESMELEDIKRSIEIKLKHVHRDFEEKGIRKRLNFGHTIAHAIEALALSKGEAMSHGLAVAVGMLGEAYLSHHWWSLTAGELDEVVNCLSGYVSHLDPQLLESEALIERIAKDKKNENGRMLFSLLQHIGNAQENVAIKKDQLKKSIAFVASFA